MSDATEFLRSSMPFTALLDLRVVSESSREVVTTTSWSEDRCTVGGVLHGGFLLGCIDATGGLAAFHNLPAGAVGTSTIESKTNFLRGVRGGDITVTARPVHTGRTTVVLDITVTDDQGRAVTKTLQTQAVLS